MTDKIIVSIIVPVFNGKQFIKNFLNILTRQNFNEKCEIIFVDDASTDDCFEIIKNYKSENLKLLSLEKNSGPSAARNLGLKNAVGEFVFFIDVDDSIERDTLTKLYSAAIKNSCDYVCSDFKRIENSINQRENKFNYSEHKVFEKKDIMDAMQRELYDPSLGHLGLFGCNGRLIKRSLLVDNKIFFDESLWWTEDRAFSWDVLGVVKNARYIKEQLYSYYVYPNVKTLVIKGLEKSTPMKTVKSIMNHVKNGLDKKGFSQEIKTKLSRQAIIFHTIQFLVSISRSIVLKKIDKKDGKILRRKFIYEILNDREVKNSIPYYVPSLKESRWIPKAINFGSRFLVEIACDMRASQVVQGRRVGSE